MMIFKINSGPQMGQTAQKITAWDRTFEHKCNQKENYSF